MDRKDYWAECISDAACECGAHLTAEQLDLIAKAVDGAHESIGMAFHVPESPYPREISRLERELSKERSRVGCRQCSGTGYVKYNAGPWGVTSPCNTCKGEGKVPP